MKHGFARGVVALVAAMACLFGSAVQAQAAKNYEWTRVTLLGLGDCDPGFVEARMTTKVPEKIGMFMPALYVSYQGRKGNTVFTHGTYDRSRQTISFQDCVRQWKRPVRFTTRIRLPSGAHFTAVVTKKRTDKGW